TIAQAPGGNDARRANPLVRRPDRCQNRAGAPARAARWRSFGAGESSGRKPTGLDDRRRKSAVVARSPLAADIGLGTGWNRGEIGGRRESPPARRRGVWHD